MKSAQCESSEAGVPTLRPAARRYELISFRPCMMRDNIMTNVAGHSCVWRANDGTAGGSARKSKSESVGSVWLGHGRRPQGSRKSGGKGVR